MSYTQKMLKHILESRHNLYCIHTDIGHTLTEKLRDYGRHNKLNTFQWQHGKGIFRSDLEGIFAPGTTSLEQALFHISVCQHFGIYLLDNIESELGAINIDVLKTIQGDHSTRRRIVLFSGPNVLIPEALKNMIITHTYQGITTNNKSLRNIG